MTAESLRLHSGLGKKRLIVVNISASEVPPGLASVSVTLSF